MKLCEPTLTQIFGLIKVNSQCLYGLNFGWKIGALCVFQAKGCKSISSFKLWPNLWCGGGA